MDYEHIAYEKGYVDGIGLIIAMFDIDFETVRERINFDILTSNIYNHYQLWQSSIKDKKISREESILEKKVEEKTKKLKDKLIKYINEVKL